MEHNYKKLATPVILTMIMAYSSDYGRVLTPGEEIDCNTTFHQLQLEIAIRKATVNQLFLRQSA